MATEIYTPPQILPPATKIHPPPTDTTGSTVYEDPNKVIFLGNFHFASVKPTITVA